MAHTKSALKRARQSVGNRSKNRAGKSVIKTTSERLDVALSAKNETEVAQMLTRLHSVLDKAAKRGIIPRNTAIRRKARANARVAKARAAK